MVTAKPSPELEQFGIEASASAARQAAQDARQEAALQDARRLAHRRAIAHAWIPIRQLRARHRRQIVDHLLQLANQHLARLHGRYLLRRKKLGELELDIVDGWQGDVARDTRTLSGGESFLVSLALALALSDLVSHKTSIDSLFLDEGFGTLDGDTLEIALSALDTLNASGKMIGIISHVEALKERIPAQIRVEKGGGVGHSRLSQTLTTFRPS